MKTCLSKEDMIKVIFKQWRMHKEDAEKYGRHNYILFALTIEKLIEELELEEEFNDYRKEHGLL